MTNGSVSAFIRLSRLHFLAGGLVMFALGAATAGSVDWWRYLVAQLMVTLAQLTAHYVNEYADYEADLRIRNRTSFSGGSGVLTSGALPRRIALQAGVVTSGVTVALAIFTAIFSVSAALLGLLALTVSWTYSMPPLRLLSTGWGELATALTVAGLVPAIGALAQVDIDTVQLSWIIATLVPLQLAMLVAFEVPDVHTDELAGKRVLAVRIGEQRTLALLVTLVVSLPIIGLLAVASNGLTARQGLGAAAAVPFVIATFVALRAERHGSTTFFAVAAFFVCGCGLLVTSV